MSLREIVGDLMRKKGLNQSQLAEASGITQATMSRILQGEVENVRPETLDRLAKALAVSVDYLLGRTKQLEIGGALEADDRASAIFRGYQKLSDKKRDQLREFVRWLEREDKKGGKGKD